MEIINLKQLKNISGMVPVLFLLMFHSGQILAQNSLSTDFGTSLPITTDTKQKLVDKITNKGFGGMSIKFTGYKDQLAIMTGGRGACIINHRFTLGGAGYGIANPIPLGSFDSDTSLYLKMGYGGIEFGYIFFSRKAFYFGSSLLAAGGATFCQSKPKSESEKIFGNDLKIFPVLEPTLYGVLKLTPRLGINVGISYRYVKGADSGYLNDRDLNGLSCYVGLLLGKNVMN